MPAPPPLPPSLRTVRTVLWVQCALSLLGLAAGIVGLVLLADLGGRWWRVAGGLIAVAAVAGLLALLAGRLGRPAPWIFWAILAVEGFVAVDRVAGMLGGQQSPMGLVGLAVAVIVVVKVCAADSRAWLLGGRPG